MSQLAADAVELAVAETFSAWAAELQAEALPPRLREVFEFVLLDAIGLCVAAREADYLRATLAACDSDGACTAIGQARGLDPAGAALVNGHRDPRRGLRRHLRGNAGP